MKKRAMKKWIPKDTVYCYSNKDFFKKCKWLKFSSKHDSQENGYCMYLGKSDWQKDGTYLLWDECKECEVSHGWW